MLQTIRKLVSGWLAVVIVALLIIPFAFWGINYYFEQGGEITIASVNGEKINQVDYQRTYQSIRQQWQSISGGNFQEGIETMLKQQALDNLVQRELMKQSNKAAGLRVGNNEVRQAINELQYFQGIAGFDQAIYESALRQAGFTPAGFEAQVRQDLMSGQLQNAVTGSAFVTEEEVMHFASLKNQTRDISYVLLSSNKIKESMEVAEQDIEDYYDKDATQFQEPERVSISYVVLSLEKIAEAIAVDDSDLLAYYEANKGLYSTEEQRKIKQLMVGLDEEADAAQTEKVEAIAAEIHGFLSAGQSFEDVAAQYADSQDINVEFSEFGFLTRGILEKEIDDVAFEMAAGEFSEPVKSKFGFHVLAVDEIKAVESSGFDSIREEVEGDYKQNEAERRFYELSDQLAAMAFEQPDDLELAASELELDIQQSELFSRNEPGPGIISDPRVVSASFSEDVLLNGNNSDVIELDNNRSIVVRVREHLPETKKPLSEVRERIVTRIKYERASEQVRDQGEEILAELKAGKDKAEMASEHSIEWLEATGLARDNAAIDRSILKSAFRLARPAEDKPTMGGTALANGDYAVILVHAVQEPEQDKIAAEELDVIRTQLQRMVANNNWSQFNKDIKEQADIVIYSDSL